MEIVKEVSARFADFVFDWYYETYLLIGGYGSGKSYHVALKIILKCLEEKRKVLVIREVYDTLTESCYDSSKPKSNPKYCALGPSSCTFLTNALGSLATENCGRTLVPLGPNLPHLATLYNG